jgi:hypothetical protein
MFCDFLYYIIKRQNLIHKYKQVIKKSMSVLLVISFLPFLIIASASEEKYKPNTQSKQNNQFDTNVPHDPTWDGSYET